MKNNSVVIVGRSNVGKSTLFNRLSTKIKSIVLDYEGVTRDFLKDIVQWKNVAFELIDLAGLEFNYDINNKIQPIINNKILDIISKSSLVIFVVDAKVGLSLKDQEIANLLRKLNKPVVVVVNKSDCKESQDNLYEFYKLGYSDIIAISAEHGLNISQLLDKIVNIISGESISSVQNEEPIFKVSFIGKPNVGKSSLLNLLLKEDRALVSEIPGTTREPIKENIMFYKQSIELTDTPGIRRKKAVEEDLEKLMVKSSFDALKDSDIVLLLIDGQSGDLYDQELKLAFYAFSKEYKALYLIINKSDLMTQESKDQLKKIFKVYDYFIKKIPVIEISCKTGKNIGKILPNLKDLWQRCNQKFDDNKLTSLFIDSLIKRPLYKNKQLLEVYKVRQIKNCPLIIELIVNEPDWFKDSQIAYFDNLMRENYDLLGVPLKFYVRKA